MAFLSAIAGESIFLLGLPGVGKSLIARRMKLAFRNAQSFEYLMSRFSTPDEIFGPVSISKLKNEDTYERLVEGYLPTADVVFLDEIWKAGPSIQNALLTVLNEKLFRNGDHELRLPLKGIISASNELPAQDEGLEALWDRYLIRIVVPPLISEKAFYKMILGIGDTEIDLSESLQITAEEYAEWQIQIDRIAVPSCILGLISKIRGCLKQPIGNENDGASKPIFVSDRRWKKIIRLLRTAAFLNGRNQVERIDCLLMTTTLWDDSDQLDTVIPKIELMIIDSIVNDRPAASKMLQYAIAREVGFKIPRSCFSNVKEPFLDMSRECTDLILKPIEVCDIWDEKQGVDYVFYAKKTPAASLRKVPAAAFSQTVSFVQEYIEKAFELRVTVVGEEVFACKIDSQAQQEETGRIDWRQGYEYGLRQEAYALPDSVASQCVAFLRRMGLNFGCFDFIVTPSGEYVFLECNPNGQWLWIELAVGLKISEAIADFLQNPSAKQTPVRS